MMRSRSPRGPHIGFFLINNPFLIMALVAGMAFVVMATSEDPGSKPILIWQTLGIGFHFVANQVERILPGLPDWLDIAMVAVVGLVPYLLADMFWRWIRPGT